jgi:hypothetical protein
MTATGAIAFKPAGGGDFDPFGQPFMGLLFWHLTDSFKITCLKSRTETEHDKVFFWCRKNIKLVVYVICGCWSIPQSGNSRKNGKSVYDFLA